MVLNDYLRGKIPWYMPDPRWPDHREKDDEFQAGEGRLGELRNLMSEKADNQDDMATDDASSDEQDEEDDDSEDEGDDTVEGEDNSMD